MLDRELRYPFRRSRKIPVMIPNYLLFIPKPLTIWVSRIARA
jgi:hypothetical protein